MSLIVAKQVEENIFIVSDTKLTSINECSQEKLFQGSIKAIILSDKLSICYAGNTVWAELAIKNLKLDADSDLICKDLLKIHNESNFEVDFILVSGCNESKLSLIKNNTISNCDNCWIGSLDGFNEFQKHFHNPEENKNTGGVVIKFSKVFKGISENANNTYIRMFQAMEQVIDSQVKEVGGFIVPLAYVKGEFEYPCYFASFRSSPIKEEEIPTNGTSKTVDFGNTQTGTYTVNFAESKSFVTIYLSQGHYGLIYRFRDSLPSAEKIPLDEIDFREYLIESEKSISLCISHCDTYKHYYINAVRKDRDGQKSKAIDRLYDAMRKASRDWKWDGKDPKKTYISLLDVVHDTADKELKVQLPQEQISWLFKILFLRMKIAFNQRLMSQALLDSREIIYLFDNGWDKGTSSYYYDALYYKALSLLQCNLLSEASFILYKYLIIPKEFSIKQDQYSHCLELFNENYSKLLKLYGEGNSNYLTLRLDQPCFLGTQYYKIN